ncbi:MAG: F0F1 ATP synthase subunit epsilon [Oceanospirillaceae bacterium]|jgi:F-type H+-transporting ATPase subunit epsilon|nr:F0F1 ATP synthase subunit epsilon [Oceanospirillaceae bacterium]MBT4444086.1 F0F1 ATP synthase subunit epsilon [Oceanospirillaceae bacterium]MBT6076343.1 F0F1 ATP synthase subunit epsilon [Oceanospirillaceae bacterium]MBT7330546.1 F0F1 ATP synthase subunit epsilon [Oceanospirillaceae bacterium]
MATSVDCDIVSAEESIFEGKVEFISLTGTLGELGIYPGHTPLLSEVKPGPVRMRKESGEEDIFYVSGGFLEVQPHKVTLMADTALRADDLNEAAAEEASRQAEQAMADKTSEFEYSRAAGQLAEAAAQLRTLRQIREKLGK